jgi:hypothetical protein
MCFVWFWKETAFINLNNINRAVFKIDMCVCVCVCVCSRYEQKLQAEMYTFIYISYK